MKDLRIVFMGTPEFAVATLDALVKAKFNVVGVITAPDKPAGRGQKINQSAVKEYAISNQLNLLQPTNLKDSEFVNEIKELISASWTQFIEDATPKCADPNNCPFKEEPAIVEVVKEEPKVVEEPKVDPDVVVVEEPKVEPKPKTAKELKAELKAAKKSLEATQRAYEANPTEETQAAYTSAYDNYKTVVDGINAEHGGIKELYNKYYNAYTTTHDNHAKLVKTDKDLALYLDAYGRDNSLLWGKTTGKLVVTLGEMGIGALELLDKISLPVLIQQGIKQVEGEWGYDLGENGDAL